MGGHGPGRMTMWRCPAPLCACQRSGRTPSPSRWRRRSWNGQSSQLDICYDDDDADDNDGVDDDDEDDGDDDDVDDDGDDDDGDDDDGDDDDGDDDGDDDDGDDDDGDDDDDDNDDDDDDDDVDDDDDDDCDDDDEDDDDDVDDVDDVVVDDDYDDDDDEDDDDDVDDVDNDDDDVVVDDDLLLWWCFPPMFFIGFHFLFLLQEPISPDDVRELLKSAPGGELWSGWWKHWGTKRATFPQNMSEWRHDKAWLKLGNALKPNKFLSKNGLVSKCGIPKARGFKPHSHDETNLGYSPLARC